METKAPSRSRQEAIDEAVERIFEIGPITPWPEKEEALRELLKSLIEEVGNDNRGLPCGSNQMSVQVKPL